MIVDCHTHWGASWMQRDGEKVENWLAVLDRHGVDKAYFMPHTGLCFQGMFVEDNDRISRLAKLYPNRLIPIGTVWPQMGMDALVEFKRCAEQLGMKAMKFHPWLQGFSTADETLSKICALAEEYDLPIIFHDGTPCYSLVEQIAGLARRFPKTTFVLGHGGVLWNWRSVLEAAKHPNIWTCLCGPHMRAIEIICNKADPDRLLWGTDFGFGFADSIDYRIDLIRSAKINDGLRQKILGENPLRLIKEL